MNDPYIFYNIARFANVHILKNLVRASRQFHTLVAENAGVRYELMDHYSKYGFIKCTDGSILRHGVIHRHDRTEYYRAGKLHRDGDLPAHVWIDYVHEWFNDGKYHRDGDLPAVIYDEDGCKIWYKNGEKHRVNGPAIIDRYGEKWYQHDILHRAGGLPAVIYYDVDNNARQSVNTKWYVHGQLHRDGDLPAVIENNGEVQMWYKYGILHRDNNLPAYIRRSDGHQQWYQNGVHIKTVSLIYTDRWI